MKKKTAKQKTPDRRIQRTKQLLSGALVELILEKGYDAVTVQDIIDRANVGRSTFYSHFESKEQLLTGGHEHFSKLLSKKKEAPKRNARSIQLHLLSLYQHTAENQQLAKALFGKKGWDLIANHLHGIITNNINMHFRPATTKSDEQMTLFMAEAAAAAILSMLVNWLENDMPFSAEEMAIKSDALANSIFGLN
jgi:AcrR family transcriptional regulator